MARQPGQVFIFNDDELSLIKNTFGDNDTLLYTVRKVLLQFPLTDVERGLIKQAITPEVLRVLKKRILPEISDEFPLGQLPSLLTTLTEQLKVKSVEEMAPLFAAKKLEIDYLTQRFEALEDIMLGRERDVVEIILNDLGEITSTSKTELLETNYTRISAYLFLLGYIDPMLNFIRSIAGEKKETPDQQKKRLMRDSAK